MNRGIVYKAYFVATRNRETQEVIRTGIWSSPPWEVSQVEHGTENGVYLMDVGESFHEARQNLLLRLAASNGWMGYYSNLLDKLDESTKKEFDPLVSQQREAKVLYELKYNSKNRN